MSDRLQSSSPPPHPADKFGKTITVSSRTTIQDVENINDDEDSGRADGNNDGLPLAMAVRGFAQSKGGNSAFKPYYRPQLQLPLNHVGTTLRNDGINNDSKPKQVEKSTVTDEDDTSDDRASDDEIKAANMGILQVREDEDDDDEDGMNDDTGNNNSINYTVVESRQDDNDHEHDERTNPIEEAGGKAGQGEGKVGCNDHSARGNEPRKIMGVVSSAPPYCGGSLQRKKPHPIAISAVSTTTLKRPRIDDDNDGIHYGVDDETPKHINIRRHPPSFSSHIKDSSSSTLSFHGHHYCHQPDNDRLHYRANGGHGYNVTQSNPPPPTLARHHGSHNPSMDDEKEDRQDRSTYATTSGGFKRQSYDDGYYHRELNEGGDHASRVRFEDNKMEREDVPAEEGGIQSSWLVPTDDRNDSDALMKTDSSHEFGGDSSIIGSSSYLNFSRSLSWEIPPGTMSGIGKSTSFSTAQPQQQNDQQHQERDGDEATTTVGMGDHGAYVKKDSDANKDIDFPPLQSIGSGSLPPRKRPISLAPRHPPQHNPCENTATKRLGGESFELMKMDVGLGHQKREQQRRSYEPPATVHNPHGWQHQHTVPSRQQDHPPNQHASHLSQVRSYDHHYHHPYPRPQPSHHHPPQQRHPYDSRFEPPREDFHRSEDYGVDHSRGGQHPYGSSARYNLHPSSEFSTNNGPGAPWGKAPPASGNYPQHHDGVPQRLHTCTRGGNTGNDLDGENDASDSRSFDSSSLSRKSFRSLDDLEEPMQNLLYRPSFSWERGLDVPYSSGNGSGGDGSDVLPLPSLELRGGVGKKSGDSSSNSIIQLSDQQKIMKALAMRSEIRTIGNPNGPMGVILLLAMPQDRHCLSETLCIVRNNIEVFTATEVDINAPAPGRKRPIQVGQVGLRCVYCRMCPQRDRVKRATCFPSSMKRIYRAVIDMKLDHFKNCPYVPDGLKGRLDQLQAGSTRSTGMTVQYFVKSAKELGMTDNLDDGVCIDLKRVGTVSMEEQEYNASSPLPPTPMQPPPLSAISMGENAVVPYKAPSRDGHTYAPPSHGKQKTAKKQPQKQKQQQQQYYETQYPPQAALSAGSFSAPCRALPFESRDELANSFEYQFPEKRYSGKVLLALPDDENFLSPLRCFLRMNVCAFTASSHDIAVRTPTTFAVRVGQVGVGCVHCLAVPPKARSNRAVCFPFAMSRIYQSVADIQRFHLGECRMMPSNVRAEFLKLQSESAKGSRGLATRAYWTDSAKKIGLADGPTGMYFRRDPSLPPPSEIDASIQKIDSESHDNRCDELVEPEDKPTIADFLYLVMEQLRPCRFTDADRNKRRSKNVGCIGVECKHCAGKIDGRKFFWSSVSAAESNFVSVHSHMLSCKYIPESLKAELIHLKALRREQTSRLKNGSQKAFFLRVWARLHGMPVPPPSSSMDSKKHEASKSKSSAPKKSHTINFEAPVTSEFDSDDIRALLESKSTLSSMPSVDDSVTKHATLDIDIGKSASADNITTSASKSSLTSMALNMSTFSVHCKEEEEAEGSGNSGGEASSPTCIAPRKVYTA